MKRVMGMAAIVGAFALSSGAFAAGNSTPGLDRYLDKVETETGLTTNRGAILRHALKVFLESKKM